MHALLVLITIGVAIWAFYKWQQTKQLEAATAATTRRVSAGRPVQNIALGDVVSYLGQDFLVEGKLIYRQEGFEWQEFRLVDGDDVRWFSVEEDDELELEMQVKVDDFEVPGRPPQTLRYRGVTYRLEEHGRAQMSRQGRTGSRQGERCEFWDYEGPQNETFSIEDWDGSWEIFAGEYIKEHLIDVLPASQAS